MTTYEHLLYEQRGPVTVITINRPERMNAIGPQTHRELVDAWGRFHSDDNALVGILTGAGSKAFCAGGDLKAAQAGELPIAAGTSGWPTAAPSASPASWATDAPSTSSSPGG